MDYADLSEREKLAFRMGSQKTLIAILDCLNQSRHSSMSEETRKLFDAEIKRIENAKWPGDVDAFNRVG